jgi:hypothetical protein
LSLNSIANELYLRSKRKAHKKFNLRIKTYRQKISSLEIKKINNQFLSAFKKNQSEAKK